MKELVSEFEKVAKISLNIEWGGRPYRNREVMTSWVSGKIVPNWKRKIALLDGIKDFLRIDAGKTE